MRLFVTGYVLGPHGLDGTFKVKSASGECEHITRLKKMVLRQNGEERDAVVEKAEEGHGIVLMKVQGVDTVEAARSLTGSEILVTESEARQKRTGEWYVDDLCGCDVVYGDDGVVVGSVKDVLEVAAGNLLEVAIDGSCGLLDESLRLTARGKMRTVIIPFTDEHIGSVSTDSRRVELRHLWVLE